MCCAGPQYSLLDVLPCWCHTLREEYRLRVFENREMKIFEPKRGEVTGELRKLHNEELYDWILFGRSNQEEYNGWAM